MKFEETKLSGAYIIDIKKIEDSRGFFARSFCKDEFSQAGLNYVYKQSNLSFNHSKGTLRGMHMQFAPHSEIKLVRCVKGAIFDVIIDLREESETFTQWISVELTEKNRKTLYIPERFAHGFLTLENDSEVYYQMSEIYVPEAASGVKFDDPVFDIQWPDLGKLIISDKDKAWPDFKTLK